MSLVTLSIVLPVFLAGTLLIPVLVACDSYVSWPTRCGGDFCSVSLFINHDGLVVLAFCSPPSLSLSQAMWYEIAGRSVAYDRAQAEAKAYPDLGTTDRETVLGQLSSKRLSLFTTRNVVRFLACCIKMGFFRYPAATDYWRQDPNPDDPSQCTYYVPFSCLLPVIPSLHLPFTKLTAFISFFTLPNVC